jgi:hypothetical protein
MRHFMGEGGQHHLDAACAGLFWYCQVAKGAEIR